MILLSNMPSDFPIFGSLQVWLTLICIATVLLVGAFANNLYFAWLHRNWPGFFRRRTLLAIFVFCVAFIAIAMWINPPSEVLRQFHQNGPLPKSNQAT